MPKNHLSAKVKERARILISILIELEAKDKLKEIRDYRIRWKSKKQQSKYIWQLIVRASREDLRTFYNSNSKENNGELTTSQIIAILDSLKKLGFLVDTTEKDTARIRVYNFIFDISKNKEKIIDWIDTRWESRKNKYLNKTENRIDWGNAPDLPINFASIRNEQQKEIERLLINKVNKLLVITGEGGKGKSTLLIKTVQKISKKFTNIIWRSVEDASPITDILSDFISYLSKNKVSQLPKDLDGIINILLEYLKKQRSLLIIDNADLDKLMKSGGQEAYAYLFKRIAESKHQSCLIITCREILDSLEQSEYTKFYNLKKLVRQEVIEFFEEIGSFSADEADWEIITDKYSSNLTILKKIAWHIKTHYHGDITNYLLANETMNKTYDWIFSLLTDKEQEITYWLAINREYVTFEQLKEDIFKNVKNYPLQKIDSLNKKIPLEFRKDRFTLEPSFKEYITDKIIAKVRDEIISKNINLLHTHSLLKAQSKEYIRESQTRLIIRPLVDTLTIFLGNEQNLENRLTEMIANLRENLPHKQGYACGNILNLLCYLKTDLNSYDFSNLTIRQAFLQDTKLSSVNLTNTKIEKTVFREWFDNILTLEISPKLEFANPKGELLAAGDSTGQIHLWWTKNNEEYLTLEGHTNYVRSVTFSSDGRLLASSGSDSLIKIWNVETGQCLKTLLDGNNRIWSLSFHPKTSTLASGGNDSLIKIWDTETGECLSALTGHTKVIKSVKFSPDGKIIASGSEDASVKIWDVKTYECLKTIQTQNSQKLWSLVFSPNGKTLAGTDEQGIINLWNVSNGKLRKTINNNSSTRLRTIAFSHDGKTIASGGDDCVVRLWDVNSGDCLKILQGHSEWVWSVAFSSDSKLLASGSEDQSIKYWNTEEITSTKCRQTLNGYRNLAVRLVFSPDCETLASGHQDRNIYLWNYHRGNLIRTLRGHLDTVQSIEFSSDGKLLASGSRDLTIKLWNLPSRQCLKTLRGHKDEIWAVAFSPDGKLLASGSNDGEIKIWNTKTGECLKNLKQHTDWIWSIAFSPDGKILASASDDGIIRLWKVSTGDCFKILEREIGKPWVLKFSPDNHTLICSSSNYKVIAWNIETGNLKKSLPQLDNSSWTAGFSPNGQIVANAINNEIVNVWDSVTGAQIISLQKHERPIWTVVLSYCHNTVIASSSWDETIKLWSLKTGECLHTLKIPRPYEGMMINGIQGLTEARQQSLIALGAVKK